MKEVLSADVEELIEIYSNAQQLWNSPEQTEKYIIEIVDLCANKEGCIVQIVIPEMTCNLRKFVELRLAHDRDNGNHSKQLFLKNKIKSLCLILDVMNQSANGLHCWNNSNAKRHNDVKPENFLVEQDKRFMSNFSVYLADLDDSEENISRATNTQLGTPSYISPEAYRGKKRTTKTDIWSFGVMCLQFLCLLHDMSYFPEYLERCFNQASIDQFLSELKNKMKHSLISSLTEKGIEMNYTLVVFSECVRRLLSLCSNMLKIESN